MYLLSYPEVPLALRPRALYLSESIGREIFEELKTKGWTPIDVRLMPAASDSDRAEIVRATLEGARVGSLKLSQMQLKFLELEARLCGLIGSKDVAVVQEEEQIEGDILTQLLTFGAEPKKRSVDEAAPQLDDAIPQESARNPARKLRGFVLKKKLEKLRNQGKFEAARKLEANEGLLDSIAGME